MRYDISLRYIVGFKFVEAPANPSIFRTYRDTQVILTVPNEPDKSTSKHHTFNQCWINVAVMGQLQANIGSLFHVCWELFWQNKTRHRFCPHHVLSIVSIETIDEGRCFCSHYHYIPKSRCLVNKYMDLLTHIYKHNITVIDLWKTNYLLIYLTLFNKRMK